MTSHESYVTLMYPTTDTNAWTHKIITLNDPVILGWFYVHLPKLLRKKV